MLINKCTNIANSYLKEQHLFEVEIFCNIINVFIVTTEWILAE